MGPPFATSGPFSFRLAKGLIMIRNTTTTPATPRKRNATLEPDGLLVVEGYRAHLVLMGSGTGQNHRSAAIEPARERAARERRTAEWLAGF